MLASVTRLRVRSLPFLPAFVWYTFLTYRQVIRAEGFRGGRLLVDKHWTFWTLTVWENERAMKAFRGTSAHAKVMPRLVHWCDEAAYAHWTLSSDAVPPWQEAYDHLQKEGKLSRVAHPSPEHEARAFTAPRLKPLIGNNLHPAIKPEESSTTRMSA
jgi:heme-degrading monooxygenase HmoA